MVCEYCEQEIVENYGSGRFCSAKCARGFSTKAKRQEINKKVSKSLKGKIVTGATRQALRDAWKNGAYEGRKLGKPEAPLNEICVANSKFSTKHVKYRLLKEGIKTWSCEECGIEDWNGKSITFQLHHINGKNKDHRIENLQMLCPNCHSQTPNYAGKKSTRCSETGDNTSLRNSR